MILNVSYCCIELTAELNMIKSIFTLTVGSTELELS